MFDLLDSGGRGDLYASDMEALGERIIAAFGDAVDPGRAATVRAAFLVYWEGLAVQMGGGAGPFTREQFTAAVTAAIGESEQGFNALIRPLVEAVFALIDVNGSGAISLDEFGRAEVAMGVPEEDSARVFTFIDTDGDGEIDLEELVAALSEYYRDPSVDSPMSGFFGALNRPHEDAPATAAAATVAALRDVVYRPETAHLNDRWRELVGTADFAYPEGDSHEERVLRSYRLLRIVNDSIDDVRAFADDPEHLAMMHEWTGPVDGGLSAIAGIHYNLFLGSVLDFEPAEGWDLSEFTSMRGIGTFLCTERAHGNDAARMETTATRDPEGFVLHTPHRGAAKFMPNTSPIGGPKTGVVAARLMIDGEDYGIHLFLTSLQDAAGPCPGVSVQLLPETFTGAVDHCATTFDRVRLPREALLGPLPETPMAGSGRQRLLHAIGRVTTGKLCMSAYGVGVAKTAVTRAVHFAHRRQTTGLASGTSVPLFAHRANQTRLLEALAATYAMIALHRHAVRTWADATDATRAEAERLVAVTKGWTTWRSRAVLVESRERCGSRGVFRANGFGDPMANLEGSITAEGDNLVVWSKAAGELVLGRRTRADRGATVDADAPADLDDPGQLQDLLAAIEEVWHGRASRRLRNRAARTPLERWNNAVTPALELVDAHAHRLAGETLLDLAENAKSPEAQAILHLVHRLFAIRQIAVHAGLLLASRRLEAAAVEDLPDLCEAVVIALAPHALSLVAAFGVDGALSHPLD